MTRQKAAILHGGEGIAVGGGSRRKMLRRTQGLGAAVCRTVALRGMIGGTAAVWAGLVVVAGLVHARLIRINAQLLRIAVAAAVGQLRRGGGSHRRGGQVAGGGILADHQL
jgi:hypothetical protein